MSAYLNVKAWSSRRNGSPSWNTNRAAVSVFIDGDHSNNIFIDAYQNTKQGFKVREKCNIEIEINGKRFSGSIDELETQLFKK